MSDKDGSKNYGMFLSISDQKLEPADNPVVMFKESPSGVPQAVQAWFYPGETYGYEFAYPHDQALKIAKATHGSVLAMKDTPQSSTDAERMTSMKSAETTHIDENDRPVSTDEQLKDSSSLHPSNTAASNNTASNNTTASSTASSTTAASTTASTGSSSPMNTQTSTATNTAGGSMPAQTSTAAQSQTAQSTTAQSTTASRSSTASRSTTARNNNTANRAVGTSGSQAGTATDNAQSNTASRSSRRSLPRTAGELPLLELLSGLALAGGFGVRAFRRR
ncbi:MAG: hypothetical protein JF610_15245 [Acidobacteria bacterium]|nr:hypothetical protein [Acidobacteriota bacterium]